MPYSENGRWLGMNMFSVIIIYHRVVDMFHWQANQARLKTKLFHNLIKTAIYKRGRAWIE